VYAKFCLVRKRGVEPLRVLPHRILNPARLPIPPLSHQNPYSLSYLTWAQRVVKIGNKHPKNMSRILVVEPQKILQQAIVLFLFPDHEVEVNENVSEKETRVVQGFDLAIVDAAALREANMLGAQGSRTVERWKIPTIWIDDAAGEKPPPAGKQLVVLGRPMRRDALQAAMAKCLGTSSSSKQNGIASLPATDRIPSLETTIEQASATVQVAGSPVIELVDVVEEEPERKKNRKQQRKSE
jgi:hypothetical protein